MDEQKILDPAIADVVMKIEGLKFDGKLIGFSRFYEGYNEAVENVLELMKKEIHAAAENVLRSSGRVRA